MELIVSGVLEDENLLSKHKIIISEAPGSSNNVVAFAKWPVVTRGDLRIEINGNNNRVEFLGGCIVNGCVAIRIKPAMNAVTNNCMVKIGNNVYFNGTTSLNINEESDISIGADCLFAHDITIITSDSHTIYDVNTREKLNKGKSIYIGNHVWVAQKCTFLKGAKVGNDSVVGYGSIVTKKFEEDNVIIAGNPAKIIKKDINWDKSNVLAEGNQ